MFVLNIEEKEIINTHFLIDQKIVKYNIYYKNNIFLFVFVGVKHKSSII